MSKIFKTRLFAFKKMAYTPKTAYYNTLHANISTTLPYSTIKIPHCNTLHLTVNTIFAYKSGINTKNVAIFRAKR